MKAFNFICPVFCDLVVIILITGVHFRYSTPGLNTNESDIDCSFLNVRNYFHTGNNHSVTIRRYANKRGFREATSSTKIMFYKSPLEDFIIMIILKVKQDTKLIYRIAHKLSVQTLARCVASTPNKFEAINIFGGINWVRYIQSAHVAGFAVNKEKRARVQREIAD